MESQSQNPEYILGIILKTFTHGYTISLTVHDIFLTISLMHENQTKFATVTLMFYTSK